MVNKNFIRKNVAFDFDGVIHIDVTSTDNYGQRHPTIPFTEPAPNKFIEIIDLIHIYHKYNYNIYIVTARRSESRNIIIKTLINFGVKEFIPDENFYFTGNLELNGDKVSTLEQLKINHFYDDSISHFKSIYNAKKYGNLKNLKNCYLTKPERNEIIKLKL